MHENTISRKTVYQGRILSVEVLEVELDNGRRSVREIVQHGVAVAIVAQLPDDRFVFIRQFRKAMEAVCFEVVAGNCDAGEDPAVAAARELREETGDVAGPVCFLGPIFPSVGYCTERIDCFYTRVLADGDPEPDEDERIERVLLSADEMDQFIREGNVFDAKTLAAWMLYRVRAASLPIG